MTDDLALALRMADAADALTMDRFGASDLSVDTKRDLTPVSDADRAAELLLRDMVATHRPDDTIVGEEFGESGSSPRSWVIDPIDGTKNYIRGVPVWATLIALATTVPLVDSSDIELGVVSAPALGRRWWATRGSGAWMSFSGTGGAPSQPSRITVSAVRSIRDASVSYSDWNDPAWEQGTRRESFDRLLRSTSRTRAYGDFWSHMMVAEGTVDAAVEPELFLWDMAALIPIVEEAGGAVTALDGSSPMVGGNALSSNGHLHRELLDLFDR